MSYHSLYLVKDEILVLHIQTNFVLLYFIDYESNIVIQQQ